MLSSSLRRAFAPSLLSSPSTSASSSLSSSLSSSSSSSLPLPSSSLLLPRVPHRQMHGMYEDLPPYFRVYPMNKSLPNSAKEFPKLQNLMQNVAKVVVGVLIAQFILTPMTKPKWTKGKPQEDEDE